MGVEAWSTTAASNNASPPNGAPEGMAASGVNDCIRQIMADVRSQLQDGQWLNWGHTPTRVDNDTFTVATDLTSLYEAGRRLKVTGSATGYCTIASSSYSAPNTTVNVTMDTGNLPGTLSAVYVALLSGSNISVPLLNASILTSGSLADARLSSNVPLKNSANTFSASQTISTSGVDANLIMSRASGAGGLLRFAGAEGFIGTTTNHPFFVYSNGVERGGPSGAGNWTLNAASSGVTLTAMAVAGTNAQAIRLNVASATSENLLSIALNSTDRMYFGVIGSNGNLIPGSLQHDVALRTEGGRVIICTDGGSNRHFTLGPGLQLGSPTGGDKGASTLNTAGAIYQNNVAVALAPLISVGAALDISSIAVGQSAYVYKTSGTARTTNPTAALDPVLQFTNAPAGTYLTEGVLKWTQADNIADFRIGWPRGVDYSGTVHVLGVDNTATQTEAAIPFLIAETEIDNASAGSSTQGATIRGTEVATAGQTLGPTWAQWDSNGNATTVTAGSWLKVTRIA